MEFKIISDQDLGKFSEKCTSAWNDGWRPEGQIVIAPVQNSYSWIMQQWYKSTRMVSAEGQVAKMQNLLQDDNFRKMTPADQLEVFTNIINEPY